ncbi:hypothetical protein BDR06DRAFT_894567, partial [Suillus hirtellus]
LPYWDPVWFVIIDGMHNLFLGVVQHHFRNLITIDRQASKAIRKLEKLKTCQFKGVRQGQNSPKVKPHCLCHDPLMTACLTSSCPRGRGNVIEQWS